MIFVIEAALKLIAFGVRGYFRSGWNRLDFAIVVFGLMELSLEGVQGLSVFRSLRLVSNLVSAQAIVRSLLMLFTASTIAFGPNDTRVRASVVTSKQLLSKTPYPNHTVGHDHLHFYGVWLPRIRKQLHRYEMASRHIYLALIFVRPLLMLSSLTCFYLFVVAFVPFFTVAHADKFPDSEIPRWNFTDIFHSFMIVFRALCGEWFETFMDCFLVNGYTCLIYYVALVIVGGFTVSIELHMNYLCENIWNAWCTRRPTNYLNKSNRHTELETESENVCVKARKRHRETLITII